MRLGRRQDTARDRNSSRGLIIADSLMMVVIMKRVTQFRHGMNLRSANELQNSQRLKKNSHFFPVLASAKFQTSCLETARYMPLYMKEAKLFVLTYEKPQFGHQCVAFLGEKRLSASSPSVRPHGTRLPLDRFS